MLLKETRKILEALFFLKGEEGVSIQYLSIFLEKTESEAENILNIFKDEYNKKEGALLIKKFGNTYKMLVSDEIFDTIKESTASKNLIKLSKASLETLAIIAYNQPITKIEIDKIRGVNSDSIIYSLVDKELIVSTKTLDTIGKPKLYETTEIFLDVFGLESLDKLPNIEENINNTIQDFLENN